MTKLVLISFFVLSSLLFAEPMRLDHYSGDYLRFLEEENYFDEKIQEIKKNVTDTELNMIESFSRLDNAQAGRKLNTTSITNTLDYIFTNQSIMDLPAAKKLQKKFESIVNFESLSQYHTGKSSNEVWSDYYWAYFKGGLANRYLSKEYRDSSSCPGRDSIHCFKEYIQKDLNEKKEQLQSKSRNSIFTPEEIKKLSPAEKYDLLIGDFDFTFTNKHLEMLIRFDSTPDVAGDYAGWMGICEGSAMAQTQLPPARNTVELKSADGIIIPFYPQDIRALASYMYSSSSPNNIRFIESRFIGSRCSEPELPINTEEYRIMDLPLERRVQLGNGNFKILKRPIEGVCRDTHPSVFHIAAINAIGKNKESFVMDSIADDEVWNYPISGYSVSYFNPKTFAGAESILKNEEYSYGITKNEAYVRNPNKALASDYPAFTNDRYAKYRSDYTYVVGVLLNVKYISGLNWPYGQYDQEPKDYISKDEDKLKVKTMTFIYDLELDQNHNIIGGEWYPFVDKDSGKMHFTIPDFIFKTPRKSNYRLPKYTGERGLQTPAYAEDGNLSKEWIELANEATRKNPHRAEVLYSIINGLLEKSL